MNCTQNLQSGKWRETHYRTILDLKSANAFIAYFQLQLTTVIIFSSRNRKEYHSFMQIILWQSFLLCFQSLINGYNVLYTIQYLKEETNYCSSIAHHSIRSLNERISCSLSCIHYYHLLLNTYLSKVRALLAFSPNS